MSVLARGISHANRASIYSPKLRSIGITGSCFRDRSTPSRQHHNLVQLVHSAINLTLPLGPFNDPATIHRASCNASLIPQEEEEQLLPMFLRPTSLSSPTGFLRPKVVMEILKNHKESGEKSIWNVLRRQDDSAWAICFADHVAEYETRTQAMRMILERWKSEGLFQDILKGMSVCLLHVAMDSIPYFRLEQ